MLSVFGVIPNPAAPFAGGGEGPDVVSEQRRTFLTHRLALAAS
jgi:hypothetical protein